MTRGDRAKATRSRAGDTAQVDHSRRDLAMTLLGAVSAGALLQEWASEAQASPAHDAGDGASAPTKAKPGVNGTTNLRCFDDIESMRVFSVPPGTNYVALVHGYATPGDGGGGMFVWSTIDAKDDRGTILNPLAAGVVDFHPAAGWRRVYSGPVNVKWFGAKGDRVHDDSSAIQAALCAAHAVYFPEGHEFRTTQPLRVDRDTQITTNCPGTRAAAKIVYEGTDFALIVNGEARSLGDKKHKRSENVRHFAMQSMCICAPNGSGIRFGSTINPGILLENVTVSHCTGPAMELGGSTYFFTMRKCAITNTRGVIVHETCDLFTVDGCSFGLNTDYDLDIGTLTFHINQSDFETNTGHRRNANKANIIIRNSDATSGYGTISQCRFGSENGGVQVPPHDIELTNAGSSNRTLRGVRIINCNHFSAPSGLGRKRCPVLLDSGLAQFEMSGEFVANYANGKEYFTTSSAANVLAGSAAGASAIASLANVPDALKYLFSPRTLAELKPELMYLATHDVSAFEVVSNVAYALSKGRLIAQPTISGADYARFVVGIALHGATVGHYLTVALDGSILTTNLDTRASHINAPVYLGAAGTIALAPAAVMKKVGRVASIAQKGVIVVDTSEPPAWASMPVTGTWSAGDFARKSPIQIAGKRGSQYVLRGWNRLTTGSSHVLNADWVEARDLTGT